MRIVDNECEQQLWRVELYMCRKDQDGVLCIKTTRKVKRKARGIFCVHANIQQ